MGHKLLNGDISFEDMMLDALLKYQYPNPADAGFRQWNTKPFINALRLIKQVDALCIERGEKAKGISAQEFGIFVLSLKQYTDVDKVARLLLDFRAEREHFVKDSERDILNDAVLIKPNSPVGDDNEPIYTAPNGVPDIECYYNSFNAICEVTMLTSRDQWYNEGQPVMRHLRDFENTHADLPGYCLFVAPSLHKDTVNTFYFSVKYEYEGQKQRIIPITIPQLETILHVVERTLRQNKPFTHHYIKQLYDHCVDMSDVQDSTQWLAKIGTAITTWSTQIAPYEIPQSNL